MARHTLYTRKDVLAVGDYPHRYPDDQICARLVGRDVPIGGAGANQLRRARRAECCGDNEPPVTLREQAARRHDPLRGRVGVPVDSAGHDGRR